jgi:Tfp pilus assembly protein PilF
LKRTLTDTLFYVKILILVLVVRSLQSLISQNKIPPKKEVSEMINEATNLMKMGNLKIFDKIKNCFKIRNAIKDDNGIATCYNTIAATFDELSEPDKAFFYYQKDWYMQTELTTN